MGRLRNIKRTLRTALYEMKIVIFSVRFLLLSVMSFVIMDMFLREIRRFALDYGLKTVPAVMPFYITDIIYGNIFLLLLIFLISDVPFRDASQKQLLSRCGCISWGSGQLLAIIGVTGLFILEQFVFSVLLLSPCLEFSGWGKVWGSVASGVLLEAGYASVAGVSGEVLAAYGPWQAVGLSMLLFWLAAICYGMLEFFFNGASHGNLGTVLLSGWSMIWIFLDSFGGYPFIRSLEKFSPQAWLDLAGKDVAGVFRTGGILAAVLVLFFMLNRQMVKKRIFMGI